MYIEYMYQFLLHYLLVENIGSVHVANGKIDVYQYIKSNYRSLHYLFQVSTRGR